MHLRHLRWEASPEQHPFIVPARIRAPESITPSVSDCFLLQTSFVVFVCIDYIMSSDKSQVFLMKRFSRILPDADLYPDHHQICSRSCTRAPVPAAWKHTDTRHYFCCQSCRTVRYMAALSHLVENQISRAGSTSASRTRPQQPLKWLALSRSYPSTGLRRSTLRLHVRGAEISQTAPEFPGK